MLGRGPAGDQRATTPRVVPGERRAKDLGQAGGVGEALREPAARRELLGHDALAVSCRVRVVVEEPGAELPTRGQVHGGGTARHAGLLGESGHGQRLEAVGFEHLARGSEQRHTGPAAAAVAGLGDPRRRHADEVYAMCI
jgi:hypothetical protein